ncbi:dephospho-CoA kinase [Candidatus Omnitrophota bacterium]
MVIGITGGFCTGKSEVARVFKGLGAKIIDLDRLAHSTLAPKTATFKKIVKVFGKDILRNNRVDRSVLARKVFGSKNRLAKLNSIVHPVVIRQMLTIIRKSRKKYRIIAVEAPLLFEAGLKKYFNYVIVVKTNKKNQLTRAEKKTGLSKKEVLERIKSQWSLKKKAAQADFIIDNNRSIKEVRRQTKRIWNNLTS